jgi:hypothetical protein
LSTEANNILAIDAHFAELRLVAFGRAIHPMNRRTKRTCGFLANRRVDDQQGSDKPWLAPVRPRRTS